MASGLNIEMISKLFERVRSQIDIETAQDLDSIIEDGELVQPGYGGMYRFTQKITNIILSEAKLFGVEIGSEFQSSLSSLLFSSFINTYPNFNPEDIESDLQPRPFVVGSDENPLPWVGGSRQGELDGVLYQQIVDVFGPPTSDEPSGDNKVQVEWDIQFDNGVRASIYDYKQYGIPPEDIDYWSVGGNSPASAAEVYKVLGLI